MPNLCKFVTEDKGDRSAMIEVPPNETDGEKGPAPRTGLPLLRVAILLCPDFTLTPMASFVDALRLAADRRDDSRQIYFAWDYYSTTGTSPVSSSGLPVASLAEPSNLDAYDCVVVCGGLIRCPFSADGPFRIPEIFIARCFAFTCQAGQQDGCFGYAVAQPLPLFRSAGD